MEDRKSVLETTTPSDALGRLTARQKRNTVFYLCLGVVVLLVLALLIGLIISNATQGTSQIDVPGVSQ